MEKPASLIRVLLVDDHAILREGLRALLSYYADIEVVGEAEDGQQALESVARLSPNVVLMDIAMPGMSGLEATRRIREEYPDVYVLILTQYEDETYVLPLLQAGASGYVPKRALGADLTNAIRLVAKGGSFLYPPIANRTIQQLNIDPFPSTSLLTQRELEILRLVVKGKTSSQIALEMKISIKTVEWHRNNIMHKLQVESIAELVRYALQHGLVE
ncbi:MAG: response regulator transcription factor [Anaerolineales bacterium]